MKHQVTLRVERETKGAVLFQEIKDGKTIRTGDPGCVIGSLYLRKTALDKGKIPATITVEVTD